MTQELKTKTQEAKEKMRQGKVIEVYDWLKELNEQEADEVIQEVISNVNIAGYSL